MWNPSKHSRQVALEHSQLESLILQRTAELQSLSQRLLKVQEEERRKLSRDLHDSTGQTLAALKISISLLQEHCRQNPSTHVLASEAAALADQAIEEIRTTSYLLHPPLLDEVGFACAAEWYVEGFAKRTGVEVKLDIATAEERLPIEIEIVLFRVLQESLTNVHRHSGASEVRVCLRQQREKIVLEIRDDGYGIPAGRLDHLRGASTETGAGLAGMRKRMHELNGKLEIESHGHGTTLRATVPRSATTLSGRLGGPRPAIASSIPRVTQQFPDCGICNSPVPLETCKTDEYGQAVHEDCYVLKVCSITEVLNDGTSTSSPANRHAIWQPCEVATPGVSESPRERQPGARATIMPRAQRVSWQKRPWNMDLAAVIAVLVLTCWITYSDRHAPSSWGSVEPDRTTALKEQVSLPLAKAMLAEYRPRLQTVPTPGGEARTAMLRRAGRAENGVVHFGDDVTVRYFTLKPASPRVPAPQYQVVHLGEDVTVRYFAPPSNTRN